MSIPTFKERLKTALDSADLEVALDRAVPGLADRRNERFANEDFRARQKSVARIRARALDRLPELIDQFTTEAEAVGCRVYLAADAAEARDTAGEICRASGARMIVKGKSNLTEEIGLNEHLEELGIKVVETDLGEWIVQIANDRPSHTLAPALHLTREKMTRLISDAAEREVPDKREALVRAARETLRHAFFEADVGISGGNFAIAETGTLVLVTNEGNGRLLSTLPPVYIAMIGVEKIVPTLQDVTDVLPALTGSATGQKISTYVSLTTGPSRSADIEGVPTLGAHGPREVHVILVDNGRLAMREDRDFRSALNCVKCGACSNVCPPLPNSWRSRVRVRLQRADRSGRHRAPSRIREHRRTPVAVRGMQRLRDCLSGWHSPAAIDRRSAQPCNATEEGRRDQAVHRSWNSEPPKFQRRTARRRQGAVAADLGR